jgi:hypothetical protein
MGYRRVLPMKRNTGTSPACSLTNCADLDLLSYLSGDICKMARSMYNCKSSMGVNVPMTLPWDGVPLLKLFHETRPSFMSPNLALPEARCLWVCLIYVVIISTALVFVVQVSVLVRNAC